MRNSQSHTETKDETIHGQDDMLPKRSESMVRGTGRPSICDIRSDGFADELTDTAKDHEDANGKVDNTTVIDKC